jgi:hypothetical protein
VPVAPLLAESRLSSNRIAIEQRSLRYVPLPLHVLQELGSWECVEMVRKYAHLSNDHLVPYVDRMSGLRLVQDGEVATVGLHVAK